MAKNFRFSGKRITLTVAADVASGDLVRQKGFIGIPLNHRLSGQSVAFALEGVWGMTFSGQGTVSIGTILYWDTSASALSIGSASGDFPAVKAITAPVATAFDGLLLPQTRPNTVDQI